MAEAEIDRRDSMFSLRAVEYGCGPFPGKTSVSVSNRTDRIKSARQAGRLEVNLPLLTFLTDLTDLTDREFELGHFFWRFSKEKTLRQSSLMLATIQPRCSASSSVLPRRPMGESRSYAHSRSASVW